MFWKTMNQSRRALLVLAAIGVGLAASAIALATIPDGSGVIHGCYQKNSGALRIIDDSVTSCGTHETSLNWNQSGPQGDQGPPGAPATSLWAVIDDDGTLLAGSGVVSVTHEGPGSYRVRFNDFVYWCAAVATPWYGPLPTAATGVANDLKTKAIEIGTDEGDRVDGRFQVAVFC